MYNNNYVQRNQQPYNGGQYVTYPAHTPQMYPNNGYPPVPHVNAIQYPQQWGQKKKRSGATKRTYVPTKGANAGNHQIIVNGWRVNRQAGFTQYTAVTTKKSKDGGKGWISHVYITVVNQTSGQTSNYWGCMQASTGKVVCDALSLVINPAAPNGGYCGSYVKRKR